MAQTASKISGKPTPVPTNKVIAASVSGALVVIAVYVLNTYFGQHVPAEIASALTVVVSAVIAYYTKPSTDQTTV